MHYPLTVTTPVIRLTVTVSIVVVINLIWQQSTTMDIGSISIVSSYNFSILLVLSISYSACLRYAYIEKAQVTLQSLVLSWASGKGQINILYECVCICVCVSETSDTYINVSIIKIREYW